VATALAERKTRRVKLGNEKERAPASGLARIRAEAN